MAIFREEIWVIGTVTILIILGSISYTVLVELIRYRKFRRLSVDSRMVLVMTIFLVVVGTVVVFVSEFRNEATLKGLPV